MINRFIKLNLLYQTGNPSMNNRVLLVSIAFPPKADPESIQTARYAKYLQRQGLVLDVVTSSIPTLFMPYDKSLDDYSIGEAQMIQLKIFENKYVNFLMKKLFPLLWERPDSKMTFHLQWKNVVKNLRHKPDVIYSRAFPLSSTFMAYKLKKHYNVPWIMHLSDPWVESPLHYFNKSTHRYYSIWEAECFSVASFISMTSKKALSLYAQKYPQYAYKMIHSPNVFDPELRMRDAKKMTASNKLRIVYAGGLANTRSAQSFLNAVDQLIEKEPEISQHLEIIFVGEMDRLNRSLFSHPRSVVEHKGLVSNEDAIELQVSADILLVIDSKIDDLSKAVFFPSKLLDYALLGKLIMAITDIESPTDEFVTEHHGKSFQHDQIDLMCKWMHEQVINHRMGSTSFLNYSVDEFYSADFQAMKLADVFKSLI